MTDDVILSWRLILRPGSLARSSLRYSGCSEDEVILRI